MIILNSKTQILKKNITKKNPKLINYLIYGIVTALILFFILKLVKKDDNIDIKNTSNVWSPEIDSQFVKSCYNKYKSQIMDDPSKKLSTKSFCRCMLEKIKTKYSEEEINKVKESDIKQWDTECRNEIFNGKY